MKIRSVSLHFDGRAGLTLIELMLAMSVLCVLMVLGLSVLRSHSRAFGQVEERLAMEREARALIAQMRDDLAVAVAKAPIKGEWSGETPGWCCLHAAGLQDRRRWLGDLTAVCYALGDLQRDARNGRTVRCLVRSVRDSGEVYQALRCHTPEGLWRNESDAVAEALAIGVLEFGVLPMALDESGGWHPWNASQSTEPDALEVRVVLASPRLMARLQTAADWDRAAGGMENLKKGDAMVWRALIPVCSTTFAGS